MAGDARNEEVYFSTYGWESDGTPRKAPASPDSQGVELRVRIVTWYFDPAANIVVQSHDPWIERAQGWMMAIVATENGLLKTATVDQLRIPWRKE